MLENEVGDPGSLWGAMGYNIYYPRKGTNTFGKTDHIIPVGPVFFGLWDTHAYYILLSGPSDYIPGPVFFLKFNCFDLPDLPGGDGFPVPATSGPFRTGWRIEKNLTVAMESVTRG